MLLQICLKMLVVYYLSLLFLNNSRLKIYISTLRKININYFEILKSL